MKLLVVTEGFPRINQPWIDNYLEQLLNHNFDIVIYSSNRKPQNYHPKVDKLELRQYVVHLELNRTSFLRALLKEAIARPRMLVQKAFKSYKVNSCLQRNYKLNKLKTFFSLLQFGICSYDLDRVGLIHAHSEILAFKFMFMSLMNDIPLVSTFHGMQPKGVNPLSDNKRKTLYGEVTRVLVNTCFAKQQAETLGCSPNKVSILPQGLPLDDFVFAPCPCPGGKEVLHLLSVGRFHRDKGYGYSLLAVARLLRANVNLHYHIVGVGQGKQRMQDFINRLDISDHVTIYEGLEPEGVHCLYEKAHLFILASIDNKHGEHVETQGVVLQEAQASGCIPIATRVGGIPECLNHEQDAILVPEKSSRAIANAVLYLLERPEEWKRYQENGRRNVEENFSADVIGKRMAEILREVAQSKQST